MTRVRGLALGWSGGHDDAACGVGACQAGRHRRKRRKRPAPKRVAGADVNHDRARRAVRCRRRARRSSTRALASGSIGISTGSASGEGAGMPSAVSRSHWFSTECRRRSSRGRATRVVYIHAAPDDFVADAHRRAAQPGEQRRARPAVKVDRRDRSVRACSRRASAISLASPPAPAAPRCDDDLVDVRVVQHDRRGGGLDEVADVRVGEVLPDGSNGRGREDDVTNLPQADQQDARLH